MGNINGFMHDSRTPSVENNGGHLQPWPAASEGHRRDGRRIPQFLWAYMMQFMDDETLGAAEQSCWDARNAAVEYGATILGSRLETELARSSIVRSAVEEGVLSPLRDSWDAKALLLALRCVRRRAEAQRLAGVRQLCEAASRERAEGGKIVAVLSDMVWVDDPAVGWAISAKRPGAAATVVVHSTADMLQFRRRQRDRVEGPVSFLPMSADMLGAWTDPGTGAHALASLREVTLAGFIGHAVNLVRLPEQHEYLRPTVLYTMLRDLAVFDTEEHAQAFRAAEAAAGRTAWAISVDFSLPPRPAPCTNPATTGQPQQQQQQRQQRAGSVRQMCISLLHMLQLEDVGREAKAAAGGAGGAGVGTGADMPGGEGALSVAQRLVATTRTRAGRTRERQFFAAAAPVQLADLSVHEQWEAVRAAERDYAAHLRALEAVLVGRRLWPTTCRRHLALEVERVERTRAVAEVTSTELPVVGCR